MDKWAEQNVSGYMSRAGHNPTMALSPQTHTPTKTFFSEWLRANYGKPVGVSPDWKSITEKEAIQMSEGMFDAAGVPKEARRVYYRAYRKYINEIRSGNH